MINASNLAKTYHRWDTAIQQLRLNFHLKVLIYAFYKNYPEKPTTAISTNSSSPMARLANRFFLTSQWNFSTGALALQLVACNTWDLSHLTWLNLLQLPLQWILVPYAKQDLDCLFYMSNCVWYMGHFWLSYVRFLSLQLLTQLITSSIWEFSCFSWLLLVGGIFVASACYFCLSL